MKLRAPHNSSGPITHKGRAFEISEDGAIEVPDSDAEAFSAHGCRPWPADEAIETALETMDRAELILRIMDLTTKLATATSTEDLRARLLSLRQGATLLPDESRAAGVAIDPARVNLADVETMNRPALFAFLRAKGAAVALPIKNDELRDRARRAVEEAT